jgi:hypothetical protein
MRKRIRKKLHKGEFQQFGMSIMVSTSVENIENILDIITSISDKYHVLFCGGGLGRFVLPSEEYGNLDIPSKVEFLINAIAFGTEPLPEAVIGYFTHPIEKEIDAEVADKIKNELEEALQTEFKMNCRIDLWN